MKHININAIIFSHNGYDTADLFVEASNWLKKHKDFALIDATYHTDEIGETLVCYGHFYNKDEEKGDD